MMPVNARRLLGFPEGHAFGNPGLPQRVPEDAHRDNLAPLSLAHECPGTLDPLAPSYRIDAIWTTKGTDGLLRASGSVLAANYERRRCGSAFADNQSRRGVGRPCEETSAATTQDASNVR